MSYLIVRSPDGLGEIVDNFKKKSVHTLGVSVMDICFLSPQIPVIGDNVDFIFTSRYGVQSWGYLFKPHANHRAFCVGQTTAQYAKHIGFNHVIIPHTHHAIALAQLIIQDNQHLKKSYIYPTGVHHKPYLEDTLKQHDICVNPVIVYDAIAKESLDTKVIDFLIHNKPLIICFSARNAVILHKLMGHINAIHVWQWHIVGQAKDVYFVDSTYDSSGKNICFYDTPQKLYDFFNI